GWASGEVTVRWCRGPPRPRLDISMPALYALMHENHGAPGRTPPRPGEGDGGANGTDADAADRGCASRIPWPEVQFEAPHGARDAPDLRRERTAAGRRHRFDVRAAGSHGRGCSSLTSTSWSMRTGATRPTTTDT